MKNLDGSPGLSYAKLAFFSIGAATSVLLLTTVLLFVLKPSAGIGLGIVLVGVVAAIAAMGLVSTRITNKAFAEPESTEPDSGERPAKQ